MWFIGVGSRTKDECTPPKKNSGSAPELLKRSPKGDQSGLIGRGYWGLRC